MAETLTAAQAARRGAVIVGAGNVASALAPALAATGIEVRQVYSRHLDNALALARTLGAAATDNTEDIVHDAEYYLVALADSAVASVALAMSGTGGLWMHTAGGVEASALAPASDAYGVFYPLQTFTKGRGVDLSEAPFFVEGSDAATEERIAALARAVGGSVSHADSAKRLRLHAAAVFACNFVNYLWGTADDILRRSGETLAVLEPLVRETLDKAMSMPPHKAQTGPAARGDKEVMDHHRSMLLPGESELYKIISDAIRTRHQDK